MRNKTIFLLLMLSLVSFSIQAEKISVWGTVTDANSETMIGVTVVVEGTTQAAITDVDGRYTISVEQGAMLEFRYLGYITKKMKAKKAGVMNVVLEEDARVLEEVVVIGYPVTRRTEMTGAISSVGSGQLQGRSYDNANSEEYSSINDNKFKSPLKEALSTFSIDVDAASYSNMRRMINQGRMPQSDAIRTEELVNYFRYDYPAPTNDEPVNISTEIGECPWNSLHRLVKIGLKAKEIPADKLPPSNLVFLIDVSGSMSGPTRLDLVKSSMKLLINNLRATDRVAIVVYAGSAGEVLPSTPGNEKQKIIDALEKLTAGGSTAGGAGIQLAYKIARENFMENGNNRIIMCSDGDFNVGVKGTKNLEQLVEEERKSGVFLSLLGYGMGNYKDNYMQALAQAGNGNHAYIDNMQEANKVLVNEFGGTIHAVAKDVKLQLEFNPAKVQAYRLIGYETRLLNDEDFNDDAKDAGEIGAGHTVTALYEVVPTGVSSNVLNVDPLKYQKQSEKTIKNKSKYEDLLTIKLRYKDPKGSKSKKMEVPVIDSGSNNVSGDFRFASAVAMYSHLLRDSEFKGDATYDKVIEIAKTGLDVDVDGYRREFIRLVETAKGMAEQKGK